MRVNRAAKGWASFGVVVGLCATGSEALAAPPATCLARVVADTAALENPSAALKAGQVWGPATQLRVNRANGSLSLCAHGDYCYPADALRLSAPCRFSSKPVSLPTPDTGEWIYTVR